MAILIVGVGWVVHLRSIPRASGSDRAGRSRMGPVRLRQEPVAERLVHGTGNGNGGFA
jgi:hypothetical protein